MSFCWNHGLSGTPGGDINIAKRMAGHSNVKTTELYDRRSSEVSFGPTGDYQSGCLLILARGLTDGFEQR
jgi:hypothetical protein